MAPTLRHIACIDDDPDILRVAQLCLEHVGGFEVSSFNSARDALEHLGRSAPDFVLLDVMMPELDGLRTLNCLRAQVRMHGVPIAFMSARVQPEEIADYHARGANGVIPKPFDPALLPQQVTGIWSQFHSVAA